jgi:hypothetical protein
MNASSDIQAHKKWKRSRDEKFPMSLSHAVLRRAHLVKDTRAVAKKIATSTQKLVLQFAVSRTTPHGRADRRQFLRPGPLWGAAGRFAAL